MSASALGSVLSFWWNLCSSFNGEFDSSGFTVPSFPLTLSQIWSEWPLTGQWLLPFGSKTPELWPLSLLKKKKERTSKWENKEWNHLKYLAPSPSLLKESCRWLKQACVKWKLGQRSESRSVCCAKEFNDEEDESWGFSCCAYWKHT